MKTVTCRKITLGEGKPKICIPIIAKNIEELKSAVQEAAACPFTDLVEWRADWYQIFQEEEFSAETLREAMAVLRRELGEIPILFTFRSKEEGGEYQLSADEYSRLVKLAVQAGADLVDIELSKGEAVVKNLIEMSHKEGIPVIVSSHDFEKTPPLDIMKERLLQMHEWGADICKLAVMPQEPLDTLRLLEATWTLKKEHSDILLITMAMSSKGSISRVCGENFGSVLTFGTAGKASAPGQIDAKSLSMMLDILHV